MHVTLDHLAANSSCVPGYTRVLTFLTGCKSRRTTKVPLWLLGLFSPREDLIWATKNAFIANPEEYARFRAFVLPMVFRRYLDKALTYVSTEDAKEIKTTTAKLIKLGADLSHDPALIEEFLQEFAWKAVNKGSEYELQSYLNKSFWHVPREFVSAALDVFDENWNSLGIPQATMLHGENYAKFLRTPVRYTLPGCPAGLSESESCVYALLAESGLTREDIYARGLEFYTANRLRPPSSSGAKFNLRSEKDASGKILYDCTVEYTGAAKSFGTLLHTLEGSEVASLSLTDVASSLGETVEKIGQVARRLADDNEDDLRGTAIELGLAALNEKLPDDSEVVVEESLAALIQSAEKPAKPTYRGRTSRAEVEEGDPEEDDDDEGAAPVSRYGRRGR